MGQPRNIPGNNFQNPWVNPSLCRWEWTRSGAKGNKRGSIKILRQITDKMQKEHGLKSTSPLLTHPPGPLHEGQSQGQNSGGGIWAPRSSGGQEAAVGSLCLFV